MSGVLKGGRVNRERPSRFEVVQEHVIRSVFGGDAVARLFQEGSGWAQDVTAPASPQLLRLLIHLFVYFDHSPHHAAHLRRLREPIHRSVSLIIRAYLKYMRSNAAFHEDMAWYVSLLPEVNQQTEEYSKFLLSRPRGEHDEQLWQLARDAGLDVAAISHYTLHNINASLADKEEPIDHRASLKVSDADIEKIRALKWLFFNHDSDPLACIFHYNHLMRFFLLERNVRAGERLRSEYSRETRQLADEADAPDAEHALRVLVAELACAHALLRAQKRYEQWLSHHLGRPKRPLADKIPAFMDGTRVIKEEAMMREYTAKERAWRAEDLDLAHTAEAALGSLVCIQHEGGTLYWMRDPDDLPSEDESMLEREEQMERLRQMYVPDALAKLVAVHSGTERYRESLKLAEQVASLPGLCELYSSTPEMRKKLAQFLALLRASELDRMGEVGQ
eukprot:TRINITY_DN3835_c0_g1_i3.p1 TRINITY_DN3835_c0_g1~~TRINITY_DN3835_c0_g1_i3.p1  ORF type:complete len:448 (+),score=141.55 TRINITY_DN3835_c0_g1_i3:244-1587(+)